MGQIERRLVKPEDLEALNAPADGLAPVFNASARKFEWKSAGAGVPKIQAGRTLCGFPFRSIGPETVSSPWISFPQPFSRTPVLVVAIERIDVHVVRVEASVDSFCVWVRDDAGVDYTTTQDAIVDWIAIEV
jgi:hypothetical protein